jgi:xanthine/CO dehydrogenase XdhC/CoxF family maturation factor
MTDLEHILPLWRELDAAGVEYVLATVVAVEGSSYRKPGARMLLAADGRRAGTVSGGCLEAAVAKKAWWLTEMGPVVRPYSTLEDDGDLPYGSGCGGVVWILLERSKTAGPLMRELEAAFLARVPVAIATVLDGEEIGRRVFAATEAEAKLAADEAFGLDARVWVDTRAARPGLWVFGAGDDAKPLVKMARSLGWFVAVADGRSHLAAAGRFVEADRVFVLPCELDVHAGDAVVIMTHSFEQDSLALASMISSAVRPAYVGVLGPQRRTLELLENVARLLGLEASERLIDGWLDELHAPVGLDLGAENPATIALSILSEIQKVLGGGSGAALKVVRGIKVPTRA